MPFGRKTLISAYGVSRFSGDFNFQGCVKLLVTFGRMLGRCQSRGGCVLVSDLWSDVQRE